jgi:hypothetical protein
VPGGWTRDTRDKPHFTGLFLRAIRTRPYDKARVTRDKPEIRRSKAELLAERHQPKPEIRTACGRKRANLGFGWPRRQDAAPLPKTTAQHGGEV